MRDHHHDRHFQAEQADEVVSIERPTSNVEEVYRKNAEVAKGRKGRGLKRNVEMRRSLRDARRKKPRKSRRDTKEEEPHMDAGGGNLDRRWTEIWRGFLPRTTRMKASA